MSLYEKSYEGPGRIGNLSPTIGTTNASGLTPVPPQRVAPGLTLVPPPRTLQVCAAGDTLKPSYGDSRDNIWINRGCTKMAMGGSSWFCCHPLTLAGLLGLGNGNGATTPIWQRPWFPYVALGALGVGAYFLMRSKQLSMNPGLGSLWQEIYRSIDKIKRSRDSEELKFNMKDTIDLIKAAEQEGVDRRWIEKFKNDTLQAAKQTRGAVEGEGLDDLSSAQLATQQFVSRPSLSNLEMAWKRIEIALDHGVGAELLHPLMKETIIVRRQHGMESVRPKKSLMHKFAKYLQEAGIIDTV